MRCNVGLDYSFVLVTNQDEKIQNVINQPSNKKVNTGESEYLVISFPLSQQYSRFRPFFRSIVTIYQIFYLHFI